MRRAPTAERLEALTRATTNAREQMFADDAAMRSGPRIEQRPWTSFYKASCAEGSSAGWGLPDGKRAQRIGDPPRISQEVIAINDQEPFQFDRARVHLHGGTLMMTLLRDVLEKFARTDVAGA